MLSCCVLGEVQGTVPRLLLSREKEAKFTDKKGHLPSNLQQGQSGKYIKKNLSQLSVKTLPGKMSPTSFFLLTLLLVLVAEAAARGARGEWQFCSIGRCLRPMFSKESAQSLQNAVFPGLLSLKETESFQALTITLL